jgi:hypothetical protein
MKTSKNEMIHIGPDWALKGDELCLTLYKRRINDKGVEQWDAKGYYPDFHQAYKAMVQKEIGPLNNIKNIIMAIDNLRDFMRSRSIPKD